MIDKLEKGTEFKSQMTVQEQHTAIHIGSGGLEVFSTPSMIALMENAAYNLLKQSPYSEESVGVEMNVCHTRACLKGTKVWATAKVEEIDGRRIKFTITAFDNKGEIGNGNHTRFIINPDKFMSKL